MAWYSIANAQPDLSLAKPLVIRDVTVISPERSAPLEHAYVLVRNGRIERVSQDSIEAEREIDGSGRFLIPGLIDSHVHLNQVPGMEAAHEATYPKLAAAARAQAPHSYLFFGFTTVVDLAGQADFIARWNATTLRPDVFFCGAAPIANGYAFADFASQPYFLYDERQAGGIPPSVDPREHTPEAVVARMASDGAICVKTYHEPGFGPDRDLPTPTLEMIRAIVSAAHARDLPVFMHANSEVSQAFAVEAGVDVIAHGMWEQFSVHNDKPDQEAERILGVIVSKRIGYQPTMRVMHGLSDLYDDNYLNRPILQDAVPASVLQWYRGDAGRWFRRQLESEGTGGADHLAAMLRGLDRVVARLAARDAKLLFGTDTPSMPTYTNVPGANGALEMRLWIAAGVSKGQLFRALTIDNARAVGLERDIGSVEAGKKAHLLLVRSSPLDTVDAYDTIDTVIIGGRPVRRVDLSAVNSLVR